MCVRVFVPRCRGVLLLVGCASERVKVISIHWRFGGGSVGGALVRISVQASISIATETRAAQRSRTYGKYIFDIQRTIKSPGKRGERVCVFWVRGGDSVWESMFAGWMNVGVCIGGEQRIIVYCCRCRRSRMCLSTFSEHFAHTYAAVLVVVVLLSAACACVQIRG